MRLPHADHGTRRRLRKMVDLTVYAPIGLAVVARERLPELVDSGRERVDRRLRFARALGRMAIDQARGEVERRGGARPPAPARTAEPDRAARPTESPPEPPAPDETSRPVPASAALPIGDYESLAASQVVARLGPLTLDELDQVEAFEIASRNRRTVLGKIAQLRAAVST
jgi:hypothetical protein